MMMNLFNSFDPMLFNLIPLNWLIMPMMFILMKNKFWMIKINMINKINQLIYKEIKINNNYMNKTLYNLFLSIFLIILINNIINIFPNLFYISSNIMYTLYMSFYMIMLYFTFNLMNNYNIFFMNLTPKNTPTFLILFINLIEMNSFFIQIITLSMRLMINMMLGHIIMNLMNFSIYIFFYMMIESLIIIIQTYVFYILILLNSNNMY